MGQVFLFSLGAVMPILALMLLGFFLRRRGFFDDAFLRTANRLVFRVALPVLLFYNVYCLESLTDVNWRLVFCALGVVLLFLIYITVFYWAFYLIAGRARKSASKKAADTAVL